MSNRKYEAVNKLDVANKKVVAIIIYSILITILPLGWWMANFGEVMFKSRQPNRIIVSIITISGIIFYSYYLNFYNNKSQISRTEFIWMLFTAFFVRLALGGAISGHPIDVNCFKTWMNIASPDIFNIYEKNIFIDYLPGYLIILALFKYIASVVHCTISEDLLIKLPNILADIAIGVMVLGLKQKCGSRPTREESTIICLIPH
ncbi:hypothetical protein [Caldicellulosiruptor bescii]|uniref:hypothetical protein n=1 Tax=Caldicellulosiruptor bescii TaxID=31899 RepID=UPI0020926789|nr:hypothetical protein [Caldicellulosiruptor bescii]